MGRFSSRYGDLRRPEQKAGAGIDQDVVEYIQPGYERFRRYVENAVNNGLDLDSTEAVDLRFYPEACRLFDGSHPKMVGSQVLKILADQARPRDGTGIYLSALLNNTDVDELYIDEFPFLDRIGFRVGKGKRLILGRHARAYSAGEYGEGIVLNWGNVQAFGFYAERGFQCNWGEVDYFAGSARGGVQANYGKVNSDLLITVGGVQLSRGMLCQSIGFYTSLMQKDMAGLKKRLEGRLSEAGFLASIDRPDPLAIERIIQFDFGGFEKEVSAIIKEIKVHGGQDEK